MQLLLFFKERIFSLYIHINFIIFKIKSKHDVNQVQYTKAKEGETERKGRHKI